MCQHEFAPPCFKIVGFGVRVVRVCACWPARATQGIKSIAEVHHLLP
jgi:hypothetical protein